MAKGSNFEREICRKLSTWVSAGIRDDIFWRAAASGAMATTRAKGGKSTFGQCGDIQAVHPDGRALLDLVTIELKRGYSKSSVHDCIDCSRVSAVTQFEKFLNQVVADSRRAASESWMIIWRRDRREALCFFDHDFYKKL